MGEGIEDALNVFKTHRYLGRTMCQRCIDENSVSEKVPGL